MVENTAVYPTRYYAQQLKNADQARFYTERQMVVKIIRRNPNVDFPPEAIVLPSSFEMRRIYESRPEEEQIKPYMIVVPLQPPISKPVLEITTEDLQHAFQNDIIKELGAPHLKEEELLEIKQKLLSWIDEISQAKSLRLTEEAKVSLTNLVALIMKKTDETIKQS